MYFSRFILSSLVFGIAYSFSLPHNDVYGAPPPSYHGQQVLRFFLPNIEEARAFSSIISSSRHLELDLWSDIDVGEVDVRVGKNSLPLFRNLTTRFRSQVFIDDVQSEIDRERRHSERVRLGLYQFEDVIEVDMFARSALANIPRTQNNVQAAKKARNAGNGGAVGNGNGAKPATGAGGAANGNNGAAAAIPAGVPSFFADYRSSAEIYDFMRSLPGIKEVNIGKTYEGRNISGFVFGTGSKNIVLNGGMHAREWIAPAVASYISYVLTGNNTDATQLLQTFTFTIVPLVNLDGYEFTRSPNGDRLWRKTRQPTPRNGCIGIDPNRSFNFHWDAVAAESNPCAENYHGPQPFTAPETKALADYVATLQNVVSYIDLHSYSQVVLYAWGWTCTQQPPDIATLTEGARSIVDGIASKNGLRFTSGGGCNAMYPTGGDSVDYFYSKGITYSYCVELRDTGRAGFILPATQIVPSGEETTAGMISLWKYVATKVANQ